MFYISWFHILRLHWTFVKIPFTWAEWFVHLTVRAEPSAIVVFAYCFLLVLGWLLCARLLWLLHGDRFPFLLIFGRLLGFDGGCFFLGSRFNLLRFGLLSLGLLFLLNLGFWSFYWLALGLGALLPLLVVKVP